MSKASDNPLDYKGPRTPITLVHPCGFCNAGDHNVCPHEIPYFEKLWICGCDCNKGWKPKDLGNESKTKNKKENKNEVRTVQLPIESGSHADTSGTPSLDVHEPDEDRGGDRVEERRTDGNIEEQEEGDSV